MLLLGSSLGHKGNKGYILSVQLFCGKKYLFGDVYGMETEIQGGENLDTFINEYIEPNYINYNNYHME